MSEEREKEKEGGRRGRGREKEEKKRGGQNGEDRRGPGRKGLVLWNIGTLCENVWL